MHGTNARKVISEVDAFFVLQCTVFGRKSKHKTDVTRHATRHLVRGGLGGNIWREGGRARKMCVILKQ